MLKKFKRLAAKISLAFFAPIFAFVPIASAATLTTTVTPTNTQGWAFNADPSTSTPYNFTTARASTGAGSLYVEPIGVNAPDKFIAAKSLNTLVSDVASVSYDFLIAGNGEAADADQFYLNVYTNVAGSDSFYDCRFDYVPAAGSGSTTDFTPVTFKATDTPANVAARGGATCPATLAAMPAGSKASFIAINVGDTGAADAGLAGYLDNAIINAGGDVTAYDFEPVLSPASKDACKNDGWQLFNTPDFKNQGDCVSYAARTKTTETTLNSNAISGINIATKKDYSYKITISGTWANRAGEVVDAECTSWQTAAWTNAVNGGYSPDLLDVQINKEFVNWGDCDDTEHTYTQWAAGDGKALNLRVFDGNTETNSQTPAWFNDNQGIMIVTVTAYPKN